MDYVKRNRQIANSYYNLGLEKANIRDLSGAVECLKKSLRFDKYQMDARNLLGLIYYEMGEVADALVQWVVSTNLRSTDNPAQRYLDELQKKPGRLEAVSQTVKKYNQALWYAQHDSDDLAILQLTRVVEDNPRFVKAHLLLAVLYMYHENFPKAGRSLYKVLQIDKNNPKAQWYMSIVKKHTGKAEVEKRKLKNAFSHNKMQDDDVIMPPSYKENTGWQSVLNILAGLVLGLMVIFFLVMPANNRALNNKHNEEIKEYSQKLTSKNMELDGLQSSYDALKADADEMEEQLAAIAGDNNLVLAQYQAVIGILQAYQNEDILTVAQLYVGLDPSLIVDENVLAVVNAVKADMESSGYQVLEELGTTAWNAGQKDEAIAYYQKSLEVQPNNPSATYLLGRLYQSEGETEMARQYFTQILTEFPESSQAEAATEALAEMGPSFAEGGFSQGETGVDGGEIPAEGEDQSADGAGNAGAGGQTGDTAEGDGGDAGNRADQNRDNGTSQSASEPAAEPALEETQAEEGDAGAPTETAAAPETMPVATVPPINLAGE